MVIPIMYFAVVQRLLEKVVVALAGDGLEIGDLRRFKWISEDAVWALPAGR